MVLPRSSGRRMPLSTRVDVQHRREPGAVVERTLQRCFFQTQDILDGRLAQHIADDRFDAAPHRANAAVARVHAGLIVGGVKAVAVFGVENALAEPGQDIEERDALRGTSQDVTAGAAADAFHQPALAQEPHELGHVRHRHAFARRDLVQRDRFGGRVRGHLQQAAQAVFFLSLDFHSWLLPGGLGLDGVILSNIYFSVKYMARSRPPRSGGPIQGPVAIGRAQARWCAWSRRSGFDEVEALASFHHRATLRAVMYEPKKMRPLAPHRFARRLANHFAVVMAVVAGSLGIGMLGYMRFEALRPIDAFLNAAMLLGGMGPVHEPQTAAGKLFAGFYALYSGLVFLVAAGILGAPVLHRMLHKFHWDESPET